METLTDRNSYVKATNKDGFCVLEATASMSVLEEAHAVANEADDTQGKAMAPFVDKMIKKYPEARFYKYDTDTADDITQELGANQMPTFHAFKDGDLMGSVTGAKAAQLEDLIKESYEGQVVDTED